MRSVINRILGTSGTVLGVCWCEPAQAGLSKAGFIGGHHSAELSLVRSSREPVLVGHIELIGVSGDLVTLDQIKSGVVGLTIPGSDGEKQEIALSGLFAPEAKPRELTSDDLNSVVTSISQAYIRAGFGAVRVTIKRESLERLRLEETDSVLQIHISEGRAGAVRTRVAQDGTIVNADKHRLFIRHSPVNEGDPVRVNEIGRYTDFLNRHPRRRVDAAISPGDELGTVTLDYLSFDDKPWIVYAQASNTGTEQTSKWREQFGYSHFNLTDNDDIFSAGYVTGDFESTHAASLSYERPFENSLRWRWKAFGDWSQYDASEVGITGLNFEGETWNLGGEVSWNFYQHRTFFLDALGGAKYRNTMTDNDFASLSGETSFFLPYAGIRASQRESTHSTSAHIIFEMNLPGIGGTDSDELVRLGRTDPSDDWVVMRYGATHSRFLDNLFGEPAESNQDASRINEVVLSVRGQYAFGDARLPPNDTAAIGGFYSVRGYPEVFATADNSVIGSAEYRYHFARSLSPQPEQGTLFGEPFRYAPQYSGGYTDWDLVLRGFVDVGHVWNNDRLSFESDETLVGAGVGAEIQLRENVSIRADWGIPLRDAGDVDAGSGELHLQFVVLY